MGVYIKKVYPFSAEQWENQSIESMPDWLRYEFENECLLIVKGQIEYNSFEGRYLRIDENCNESFVVLIDDIYDYDTPQQYSKVFCKLGDDIIYEGNDIEFLSRDYFERHFEKFEI